MKKDNGSVVRLPEKLGFLGLSTASNVVFNFKSIYYTIFLTNVLHIPIAIAGYMNTAGLVWDFVNDPLVGVGDAHGVQLPAVALRDHDAPVPGFL